LEPCDEGGLGLLSDSMGRKSESRVPEIGTPGLMSEDGKRGDGHWPQATAPILDLYEAAVVKGISVVFSDLDSLWLRMLCAVKPRSREAVRRRRRA
jgi:hypothetical protein